MSDRSVYWVAFGAAMGLNTQLYVLSTFVDIHLFRCACLLSLGFLENMSLNRRCARLPILYCLLIVLVLALGAHVLRHDGCGPRTKEQGPNAAGAVPGGLCFWTLGLGSRPSVN